MAAHELLAETQPDYRRRRLAAEAQTRERIASGEAMRVAAQLITLPVAVHVVQRADEPPVTDAQIDSQIAALNRDFSATNPDRDRVPAVWQGLVADAGVAFELAAVTRTATTVQGFGADDAVKSAATGGHDATGTDEVLDVWVCELAGGLLGYGQFPGGPAATDGVVLLASAFGTEGTATAPFDLGRTATHEVGHFLGLRHIWGDRNDCTGDDLVADTPPAREANVGTPTYPHVSCDNGPDGDMFMNYMDYVDDAAMVLFTRGQVARMNATLSGPRKALAGL